MLFLIQYDRTAGKIVQLRTYADANRSEAHDARLDLELDLHRRGVNHEVVMLEAPSLEALLETHSRYFRTLEELVADAMAL